LRRPVELAQYLAIRYTERLADAGVAASVGSRGDSYDNALAESFNYHRGIPALLAVSQ
jgi:putative transposase